MTVAQTPKLHLLGPSQGLVKKHWDRLPLGTYALMALRSPIPIEPITPSNQLSYILTLEHSDQRILVSGDAGCVDFKPGRHNPYHRKLIDALVPLHVVQVAHHGGHNAHFYRCLIESGYVTQEPYSYLLLSHATNDKYRPLDVFTKFIEESGKDSNNVELLFTSQPKEAKVRDVKSLIGCVVGPESPSGDIRLVFEDDRWTVKKHALRVV